MEVGNGRYGWEVARYEVGAGGKKSAQGVVPASVLERRGALQKPAPRGSPGETEGNEVIGDFTCCPAILDPKWTVLRGVFCYRCSFQDTNVQMGFPASSHFGALTCSSSLPNNCSRPYLPRFVNSG